MGTDLTTFKGNLGKMIERGEFALPSTIDSNAFRNACIVAFQNNSEIRKCTPESVFTALRHLAGVGLMPDGREAAIVRFGDKAQAMPMVWGMVAAVKRSASVTSLWAEVVYDNEVLEVWIEDGEQKFSHTMTDGSRINPMRRGGQIQGAYAVAKLKDGSIEFEPMGLEQIEKRRLASPNQKGPKPTGIWADWYLEQAKKTVIRSLCKRLPMSAEDKNALLDKDPTLQEIPEAKDVTPQETTEERLRRVAMEKREDTPHDDDGVFDSTATEVPDLEEEFAPDEGEG